MTEDEKIMQAALEACAIAAEELGLRTSASEYRKAKGGYGFEVRTAACAIRAERARTKTDLAAAWAAGRDAAAHEIEIGRAFDEKVYFPSRYIRALTPPPEFASPEDLCEDEGCPHFGTPHVCISRNLPEDKRDAEIARLRDCLSTFHQTALSTGTVGLPDSSGGWIEIDSSAEYCGSGLYERTTALLEGRVEVTPRGGIKADWWTEAMLQRRELKRLHAQVSERDAFLRRLSEWLMISARVSSAGKKLCEKMNSLSEEIGALFRTEGE